MELPKKLYRYRPLAGEGIAKREIDALEASGIFAARFNQVNDPMEAFFDFDRDVDRSVDQALETEFSAEIYGVAKPIIEGFALISFSSRRDDLPMWAYYASGFTGMCLEYDIEALGVGDDDLAKLFPVDYADEPHPALSAAALHAGDPKDLLFPRLLRKPKAWAHEAEWRAIYGAQGLLRHPPEALTRIILGPRIDPAHRDAILGLFTRRPAEVVQALITGWRLELATIQPPTPLTDCVRLGAGRVEGPEESPSEWAEAANFLSEPVDRLAEECQRLAKPLNIETVRVLGLSVNRPDALCIQVAQTFGTGIQSHENHFYDRDLNPLP